MEDFKFLQSNCFFELCENINMLTAEEFQHGIAINREKKINIIQCN